ncbi:MAG: trans-aconitate 2-methyltransferase [Solirubrobacteraceae bacterium]|jgi:trans-aconitate 2-methyltransferase|nr:trans-aconitate 2-methyltransferase [Solirubrobacteraceae bacterium]
MTTRDWNAESYDVVSTPQQEWGAAVLGRLELRGDEQVLDAGCGTGRVTQMLLDRLPDGHVVAVDGSPSMAAAARARLDPARVDVICSDLLDLSLDRELDAAISTATFHWIADHDLLFARIRACLRAGGAFVAQCGGYGNIDRVRAIAEGVTGGPTYAAHFAGWPGPWNYATPEDTQVRLEAAGFEVDRCWLEPAPVIPPRPREFLATVICGPYLDRLPSELRDRFLDDLLDRLGPDPVLDYVRLNWDARAC